jgi:hypothetical protein
MNTRWVCACARGIAAVMVLSGALFAEISLGSEVRLRYESQETGSDESSSGTEVTSIRLTPGIGIRVNQFLEVRPAPAYQVDISSTSNSQTKRRRVNHSAGARVGIFFHLADNDILDFSLGLSESALFGFPPRVTNDGDDISEDYDTYLDLQLITALPANLDIKIARLFSFRIAADIYRFALIKIESRVEGSERQSYLWRLSDFTGILSPSFGFVFHFGRR